MANPARVRVPTEPPDAPERTPSADALGATTTLDRVPLGRSAVVVSLALQGAERRRLLDLGLLPGSTVRPELTSPLRDPTAYLVRGALIALRRRQARAIRVELAPAAAEGASSA